MDWLYLTAGLAVLLVFEKERHWRTEPSLGACLGACVREAVELVIQLLLLLSLWNAAVSTGMVRGYEREWMTALFLLVPYGINQLGGRKDLLYLAVFMFGFWAADTRPGAGFWPPMIEALKLTGALTAFQLLLLGLRRRLLFSAVPKILAGLPALLILAAVLAWVFAGMAG
ncbi:MAG: hypothetical protein WC352_01690 [Candidatus Omnitrophota bacterium]|jgi:hypothetical protein